MNQAQEGERLYNQMNISKKILNLWISEMEIWSCEYLRETCYSYSDCCEGLYCIQMEYVDPPANRMCK